MINRPGQSIRRKAHHFDSAKEGEGTLVLKIGDKDGLRIGSTRIYLDRICISGDNGGKREVSIVCIGPKTIPINRIPLR